MLHIANNRTHFARAPRARAGRQLRIPNHDADIISARARRKFAGILAPLIPARRFVVVLYSRAIPGCTRNWRVGPISEKDVACTRQQSVIENPHRAQRAPAHITSLSDRPGLSYYRKQPCGHGRACTGPRKLSPQEREAAVCGSPPLYTERSPAPGELPGIPGQPRIP